MLRVCLRGLRLHLRPSFLQVHFSSERLERYAAIKAKNDRAKQLKR